MQSRLNHGSLAKLADGPRTSHDLSRAGAGASRGPGQGKKLNAAPWSQTWPAPGATLDLDFANDRGYVRGVGQGRSMDAVTFTRASNGNYVKPDGTLSSHANQGALGNNLLTFPQDFDNAAWQESALNRTAIEKKAAFAPDGTLTADLFMMGSDGANAVRARFQNVTITTGTPYIFSVYVKQAENSVSDWIALRTNDATNGTINTFFQFSTGSFGTVGAGHTASADAEDNGWYRLKIIYTFASTSTARVQLALAEADNDINLVGTFRDPHFYAWGAQLEVGSTATEYFPTNINQPRFYWASTATVANKNLLSYTEQFDNGYWVKAQTIVVADTIATTDPLGTNTADLFYPTGSGNFRAVQRGVTVASLNIKTISVYAKAGGLTWLSIRDNTSPWAFFDLTNGVLGTVTSGYTASITDVGDGWYRCVATNTNGVVSFLTFMVSDANNGTFVTANGTDGIYLWGAQGETGTSVTDYQPVSFPTTNTPLAANPTSNGLLIEEARTNRLLWNRDATDAAWVKTDVTAAKDQTGIDGVAIAASSLTSTADGGTCIQTITLASGSRTGSVFLKRITGTGNVQVTLDGSTWSTVDLSADEWRRIVLSGTVTNPVVGIKLAVSGDAVAMDYGQVEDGLSSTTPILTTTASVTRAVDSNTRVIQDVLNLNGATVYAEFSTSGLNQNNSISAVVGFGSTANSNPAWYPIAYRNDNVSTPANPRNINAAVGVNNKVAATFAIAGATLIGYEGATNGETPADLRVGTAPTNLAVAPLNQIGFGNYGRSGNISTVGAMRIKRVILFNKANNTNTLQELSR
jgi:hypothetical protein